MYFIKTLRVMTHAKTDASHETQRRAPLTLRFLLSACLLLVPAAATAVQATGTVQDPGALGVENVNVDFIDRASGQNIPIASGDTTNASGQFTVDVPNGSYDITYSPPLTAGLAGAEQLNVTISGDTTLPTVTLPLGYQVTLQAVDVVGNPVPDVVATFHNASQQKVFTPSNTTDSGGTMTTVLPQADGPYSIRLREFAGLGFAEKELIGFDPTADTNLGPVIVGFAQPFTGRTIRFGTGTPVADVNVDVVDACGLELHITGDLTDAAGTFSIAGLVDGDYTLIFRPPSATGLARKTLTGVGVDEPLLLGDVVLGVARTVSGRVINSIGTPLANIDLDFRDQTAGYEIDTPGDDTLADGTFAISVPEGLYIIDFRPLAQPAYAPLTLADILVDADLNLGDIVLENAVTLSGTVTDFDGFPVEAANLDVFDPATGVRVFTPDDMTDASGLYAARLSPGTWNLRFSPPPSRPDLWHIDITNYEILTTQTLDVVLPRFAGATNSGRYR
jgi:hypothetical protein